MKTITLSLLSLLVLSACMNANTTSIQRGYVTQRDGCRAAAETQFGYAQAIGGASAQADDSATLAQLFSDCMESRGWAVASKRGKPRPGSTPALDSLGALPQAAGGRGPAASVSTAQQPASQVPPLDSIDALPQQYQEELRRRELEQQQVQQPYQPPQYTYTQPQGQPYQQGTLSPQQEQALQQQYYQQQQAYQNYLQQQQAYQQQYQQYYNSQPQAQPQGYQPQPQGYQQPQAPQQQYYAPQQPQQYQAPQYQAPQYQQQQYQQQSAPQGYYQPAQVEPIQHSATSLHLSRGGIGGARAK